MNIVDQLYWDTSYLNVNIERASPNDPIVKMIYQFVPFAKEIQTAYEIGCFPGRYLSVFGDLGYVLNGVDKTPRINEMPNKLHESGYQVGDFYLDDFMNVQLRNKVDIVASFGFIEHFQNWEEIIRFQSKLVNDKGLIILTTPNFKGLIQYLYHLLLDYNNFKRHIIESMSPIKWEKILNQEGFTTISSGFIGNEFWDENPKKNWVERFIMKCLVKLANIIKRKTPNHPAIGSYCYIIAIKK